MKDEGRVSANPMPGGRVQGRAPVLLNARREA
jgi:hypothetical protein